MEQREQRLQGIGVRLGIGAQQEDLGIELLERTLEIVGVGHLNDALDAQAESLVPDLHVCRDDDRVGRDSPSAGRLADQQEWEMGRVANSHRARPHYEGVCALLLRATRLLTVGDLHEHGYSVTLGDRLAQPAHRAGCY